MSRAMRQRPTRAFILDEARLLAAETPGQPLGRMRFTKATGIKPTAWEGIYWATWSALLQEAGVGTNTLNQAIDERALFQCLADLTRELGKVPTSRDLRLASNHRPGFPTDKTFLARFGSKAEMIEALRRWVSGRAEDADVAALLPSGSAASLPASAQELASEQNLVLSDGYVPPVIGSLPALARMESAQPIEFERRVAVALEILGLSVQRLGQGSGREPDGIAMCRQHGWAVIYDAKARAGIYRIQTEDRKFREYIERYTHELRSEGMTRLYFAVVSSGFNDADLPRARALALGTDVKSVALIEASALVVLVERHLRAPLIFGLPLVERAFAEIRIVRRTEVEGLK